MAKDALGAHARDELGIPEITSARQGQAALASAATFAGGAALPLLTVVRFRFTKDLFPYYEIACAERRQHRRRPRDHPERREGSTAHGEEVPLFEHAHRFPGPRRQERVWLALQPAHHLQGGQGHEARRHGQQRVLRPDLRHDVHGARPLAPGAHRGDARDGRHLRASVVLVLQSLGRRVRRTAGRDYAGRPRGRELRRHGLGGQRDRHAHGAGRTPASTTSSP